MTGKPVFQASLDQFEGPLDLMLHLVTQNKLDLFKLDLYQLATQYVQFILSLQDLNVASEYMVEFARLLEYKSKKLLPNPDKEEEEALISEYSHRLLDYQQYRDSARRLAEKHAMRLRLLERGEDEHLLRWKSQKKEELAPGNVQSLVTMFNRLMQKQSLRAPSMKLEKRDVSIQKIKEEIDRFFSRHTHASLEELLDLYHHKEEKIVCFLAVLEGIHERSIIWNGKELIHGATRAD